MRDGFLRGKSVPELRSGVLPIVQALPQCGIDQRIDCSKFVGIGEEANRFPDLGKQKSKTANLIGNAG
jgi:hypothetical protein